MKLRLIACVAPIALLAACGGGADNDADGKDVDPASEQALNDDLMSDPDMAGRNEAGAALSELAMPISRKSTNRLLRFRPRKRGHWNLSAGLMR